MISLLHEGLLPQSCLMEKGLIYHTPLAQHVLRSQRRVASPSHYNSRSKLAGWLLPFSHPPLPHLPHPNKQTLP